jgi:filamentous hemagglutinin
MNPQPHFLVSHRMRDGLMIVGEVADRAGGFTRTTLIPSIPARFGNVPQKIDTTFKGAVVKGDRVTATVGGSLTVESLQDTSQYDVKSQQVGGSVTIGPASGASLSLAKTKINSDFTSVGEQSAIRAGDGGFAVNVAGNTTLTGGQITSTQAAIDNNQNSFQTGGTLTTTDLHNRASFEAQSVSVAVGTSGGKVAPGGVGFGSDSGSASSTTTAGISGVAGNTAARTGDKETGIGQIFNKEQAQQEVAAQVAITQEFGKQASKAVGDYAQTQKQILREAYKNAPEEERAAIQAQFDDLILQERVMNVLIGAVTGLADPVLAKETLALAGDEMQRISLENSMRSTGFVDAYGNVITNLRPGEENKPWQDRDLGGTRLDPDGVCGPGYERGVMQRDANNNLVLDANGRSQFIYDADGRMQFRHEDISNGKPMALQEFFETAEGKKMLGATGGLQGGAATLIGRPYPPGGVVDRVIKAFAGEHDYIGGQVSGLYDGHGNAKQGRSEATKLAHEAWSVVAIAPSIPFAMAELMPPEFWKAISILLGAAK